MMKFNHINKNFTKRPISELKNCIKLINSIGVIRRCIKNVKDMI